MHVFFIILLALVALLVVMAVPLFLTVLISCGLLGLLFLWVALVVGRRASRVQTGADKDERPVYTRMGRLALLRRVWETRPLGVTGLALVAVTAPLTWLGNVLQWRGLTFVALLTALAALVVLLLVTLPAGRSYRRTYLAMRDDYRDLLDAVAFISQDREPVFHRDGEAVVITGPPAAVAKAHAGQERVSQVLPGYVLDDASAPGRAVVRPASADEQRRAAISAAFEGLVTDAVRHGDEWVLSLVPGISPTKADEVAMHAEVWLSGQGVRGGTLLEWEPVRRRAVAGALLPAERELRDRIAQKLGARAHEITLNADFERSEITEVRITRTPPAKAMDGESAVAAWRRVMLSSVPGAHEDWAVTVDRIADTVTLSRRDKRTLLGSVSLADILPERLDPNAWAHVPVGLDPAGRPQGQDLSSAPMSAIAGPTGSGKTVLLVADMAQRLVRGHDIAIIDPTKGGVDFASFEPYARGFARDYADSVTLIKSIYAEGVRRKAVLLREQEVKWSDLSTDVREREGIRPVTLYIDEAASLLLQPAIPKGLPKDDPEFVDAQELAAQKSILSLYIGKIARELRFVGVHLALAMQRPDASILGGEVRSNLSHRVQLVPPGKPIGRTELEMLFPALIVGEVYDEIKRFDDGQSRGLGVLAGDEGDVIAVRVAFAAMRSIPELLNARGVKPANGSFTKAEDIDPFA